MRVRTALGVHETGFLLPPLQSEETVRVAAAHIAEYRSQLGRPVAFETGVNYLRHRYGSLEDGDFFRRVSEDADAGILLDLHNLWCNHVNGRAELPKVLDQIPLDRVWEVHLAGGSTMDGLWLDAHSGPIPEALVECALEIMPRLSALRALIYEVMPDQAGRMGLDQVQEQLSTLRSLWRLVPSSRISVPTVDARPPPSHLHYSSDLAAVEVWEQTLHAAIRFGPEPCRGQTSERSPFPALTGDPGLDVYRKLVTDARLGSIARTVRYTTIVLLMHLGSRRTHELLERYTTVTPAQSYAAIEGSQFCTHLRNTINAAVSNGLAEIPYLSEVLAFEAAVLKAAVFGESSTVLWSVDPASLLSALDIGVKPINLPSAPQTIVVHASTDRPPG
ncbi:multinuclear nonheme iron-dependent oxidase [Rhodococcus koreensis]